MTTRAACQAPSTPALEPAAFIPHHPSFLVPAASLRPSSTPPFRSTCNSHCPAAAPHGPVWTCLPGALPKPPGSAPPPPPPAAPICCVVASASHAASLSIPFTTNPLSARRIPSQPRVPTAPAMCPTCTSHVSHLLRGLVWVVPLVLRAPLLLLARAGIQRRGAVRHVVVHLLAACARVDARCKYVTLSDVEHRDMRIRV